FIVPVPITTSMVITIYLAGRETINPYLYAIFDTIFRTRRSRPVSPPPLITTGEILDAELLRNELLAALTNALQADGAFVAEVIQGSFVPEMDLDQDLLPKDESWPSQQVLQVSAVFGKLPIKPGQRLPVPEPFPREAAPVSMLAPLEREAHSWYGLAIYGQLSAAAMSEAMLGVCSLQRSIGLNQQVRDTFDAYARQLEMAQQIIQIDQRRRRSLEQASNQEESIRKLEDRIQALSVQEMPEKRAVLDNSPLRIRVLGPLEVTAEGKRVPDDAWKSERARELLAYLLWKGQIGATGAEIQEILWPARNGNVNPNTVYVTINRLRKVLEPKLIRTKDSRYIRNESGRYFFDFDAPAWLDVNDYLRLVASDDLNDLRQAIELYRGRYMQNIGDILPPDVEAHRRTLENMYIRTLRRLIAGLHGRDDDLYLELLLAVEPLDDDANQLLVEHYLGRGRDDLALSHLGRYRQALDELDTEPSPAMRKLWRKVEQKVQQRL
ncbi:MAG: BTAD domain-containing putative transcriptional regulator, partial [Anaerolineales bacterium]